MIVDLLFINHEIHLLLWENDIPVSQIQCNGETNSEVNI